MGLKRQDITMDVSSSSTAPRHFMRKPSPIFLPLNSLNFFLESEFSPTTVENESEQRKEQANTTIYVSFSNMNWGTSFRFSENLEV